MSRNFNNIIDYVRTQLQTFEQRSLCRVDSLVFSCLAYLRIPQEAQAAYAMEGICIKDLYRADWFDELCNKVYDPQAARDLLAAVAANPRFRDVRVCGYSTLLDKRTEQQFCAMSFRMSPYDAFVAFRGTDNTLVGWKEDFNMSFQTAVPSQVSAVLYLEWIASQVEGRIWCGGHSKGGNLAVYAGVMCKPQTRERVQTCFSHDGPGFSAQTMSDDRWRNLGELVDKTIPQSSVIGMIFEQQEREFSVVHSRGAGFSQHDPYKWEVDGCDFVLDSKLQTGANIFDSSINEWLGSASEEEREHFVDTVFGVLESSGETTMGGIRRNWRTTVPKIASAIKELDVSDRVVVINAVADVLYAMLPTMPQIDMLLGRYKKMIPGPNSA